MAAVFEIELPGASDDMRQEQVIVLSRLLSAQSDVVVERPAGGPVAAGERGAALTLGTLLVSVVAPEAVKAVVDVLKLFFARSKDMIVVVTGADGAKIEIRSNNLDPDKAVELVGRLRTVMTPGG